jgi:hypothetical protein
MTDRDYEELERDEPQQADIDELGDDGSDTLACPSCGREIYEDSDRCPYCGNWVVLCGSAECRRPWWKWVLIPLVVAAMLIYLTTC